MRYTLRYEHSSQDYRRVMPMLRQLRPLLEVGDHWVVEPPGAEWAFDGELSEVLLTLQRELESRMSDDESQMGTYYLKVHSFLGSQSLATTCIVLERP